MSTPQSSDLSFPADVPDDPSLVTLRREGDAAWLTISRPEVRNCLSFATLRRFRSLLAELREDLSLRCVLITGAGERAFCAGADLKERRTMDPERVTEFLGHIRALMNDVETLPQPTIGVVNGFALGGGTELLLACDLRVADPEAGLGLTETSLAIIPGAGGTQRLPRLIGKSRAKDLILTARTIGATEAHDLGLVNRLAAAPGREALDTCARDLADAIAQNGPVAVRAAKEAMELGGELPLAAGLEQEERCYAKTLATEDRLEALAAFAEKRPPHFKGR
ncbi:MAG: enoyl-CoA hydratase-related protein [Planctomycetota bacterium]|jgi:enoyl-CoA hydratase/carnithine racemase|nr:enoyl-CoA hydratase [Planctomycetota bacterium]MDP6520985.1 enoyl-CoA hydratase-related protein [Planctomycetota bacterium]MDP6955556.1 enoyl-CoA hydratase-related protein [Planctomycetota bacterium]